MDFPDYPFASHYFHVNGLRLHYLDEGDEHAAAIVMLHGNPGWSFYYRKLVSALRDTHRCIVPDHIGMGLSDKPGGGKYSFTLKRRANDLEALLAALGVTDDVTLVLHDWGGMIGMVYASRYPERIRRLVILNTAAFHPPGNKSIPWQLKVSRIPLINQLLNQGLNVFCRGAVRYGVTRKPMPEAVAAAYLFPYDSWRNRLAVRKFVEDIPLREGDSGYDVVADVDASLSRLCSIPVLICWGMLDFVFDGDFLNEWIKRFPGAQTHWFEDAGHYVLEDAADEIIPLISAFLTAR